MRLAGTYHPIAYLLKRLPEFLPGVQRIHGIWCDDSRKIRSTYGELVAGDPIKASFQQWRNHNLRSLWVSDFDPFQFNQVSFQQMSLSDEDNLDTLLLFFDSTVDSHRDLIAIEFPKSLFLKNFNVEFSGISAQEKQVLSNLLSSILFAEHERCIHERELLNHLSTHQNAQRETLVLLREQLSTAESLYSSAISTIIKDLTAKFEQEFKTTFEIDQSLVRYYAKEQMSLSLIEGSLERIITLAYHMNMDKAEVTVDESYIQVAKQGISKSTAEATFKKDSDKVIDLLNRYEYAASLVQEKERTLNAKEIARKLDPPVTPPAITDAIKKNAKRIAYYLHQYPNRWPLIRKAIRPIHRIDERIKLRREIG